MYRYPSFSDPSDPARSQAKFQVVTAPAAVAVPALNRGAPWMMDVDFSKRNDSKHPNRFHCDGLSNQLNWSKTFPKIRSDSRCFTPKKTPADEGGPKWGLSPFRLFFFFFAAHHRWSSFSHANFTIRMARKMERLQVDSSDEGPASPDGVSHGLGWCWVLGQRGPRRTKEITRKPRQRPPKVQRDLSFWISGSFSATCNRNGQCLTWPTEDHRPLGKFGRRMALLKRERDGPDEGREAVGTLFSPIFDGIG